MMNLKTESKTKDMTLIALFAVIISICAWISIPTTIPFTMQTFGVFLALDVLGGKKGTFSIIVYLLLGIVGVPVFAGGMSGIGTVFGNTGGYMIGWILGGLIMCVMEHFLGRKNGCCCFPQYSGYLRAILWVRFGLWHFTREIVDKSVYGLRLPGVSFRLLFRI